MDTVRPLTDDEIAVLVRQGCSATSWADVRVRAGFAPEHTVTATRFAGVVELGAFGERAGEDDPDHREAGIHHAHLRDVTVGDGCRIMHADIADADIGDNCLVYKTDSISHAGFSRFGNGSPCHVVAEDGARSVPLWRGLSAQWAHLVLHLKNDAVAIRLEKLVAADAQSRGGTRSHLAEGCRIRFAGTLRNVDLGPGTVVEGAARLVDCTVVSSVSAPAYLGEGVAAEDCVFLQGSRTAGGTRLVHSLVGEGVNLDNAFFTKHSMFFANSEFTLGEAACGMAGPFAVSHHRATLILTCQCSFNTFGSGANSSNHHFKLGPRHGGVLRRGTRCGSGSYLFWPSDIGAFSTVVGRHAAHLDTTAFPFSLLVADGNRSLLIPGVNLFSAGAFRDERKWPRRDRRAGIAAPRDLVNSAVMSPYVMQAAREGLRKLEAHRRTGGAGTDMAHGGVVIPASRLEPAATMYESALVWYLGNCLARNLAQPPSGREEAVRAVLDLVRREEASSAGAAARPWRDWGGMLVSGARAEALLAGIEGGDLVSAEAIDAAFAAAHSQYARDELAWVVAVWLERYGPASEASVSAFLDAYRDAFGYALKRLLGDAAKEFADGVTIGFGVEGEAREAFQRVRGDMDDDPAVAEMLAWRNHCPLLAVLR